MAEYRLRGQSRLTSRWRIPPVDRELSPLNDILVGALFDGCGNAISRIGEDRFRTRNTPGSITVIPRGYDSEWHVDGEVVASHVYLGNERLTNCNDELLGGGEIELISRSNHVDVVLFRIMQLINQELEAPRHYSLLFMEHALDALCLHLIRCHSPGGERIPKLANSLTRRQLTRVMVYMRDNLGADISLQDLADVLGMSRFHFCSAFRRAVGVPPYEYLTRQRIKLACDLLKERAIPIGIVATSVGYSSPSSFSMTFRRIMGMTPTQYRSQS